MNAQSPEALPVVEMSPDYSLRLPPDLMQHFSSSDRFTISRQGNRVVLERIGRPRLTDLVTTSEENAPFTIEEINEMIHEMRREQAQQKADDAGRP